MSEALPWIFFRISNTVELGRLFSLKSLAYNEYFALKPIEKEKRETNRSTRMRIGLKNGYIRLQAEVKMTQLSKQAA